MLKTIRNYCILFLLFGSYLTAQRLNIDSLRQELSVSNNDSNKVKTLNALAYNVYVTTDKLTEETGALIDSAIALSERIHYNQGNINARFNAGNIYKTIGNTQLAIKYLLKGIDLCDQLKSDVSYFKIYNSLGNCYSEEGNFAKAGDFFYKALRYAEKTENIKHIASSYNSLGNFYGFQGEYSKAINYYLKSLKYNLTIKEQLKTSFNYVNLGNTYSKIKKYDSAVYYFNKALVIQSVQQNKIGKAYSYNGIGLVYFQKNQPEAALDYYKRAFALLAIDIDAELSTNLYVNMGNVYIKLNKLETAEEQFKQALTIALSSRRIIELSKAYDGLSKIYYAKNKFKEAFDYNTLYISLKDSINNSEIGKKTSALEYNYQIEQDKKISQLENDRIQIKHEQEVKQQRIIITSISLFLIVVFILSIFIYRAYKQKAAINVIVNKQKQKVENQKRIIEVKQKEMLDSINYAKRIQFALLAHSSFLKTALPHHFILFKPKDIVSGDFYWSTQHNDLIFIAVCDCTGHGVPGAFMSVLNIGFLNEAIKEKNITAPNEIFNFVRKRLIDNLAKDQQKDGMDGVLICINPKSNEISYAAANNAPVLIRNKSVTILNKDKMPVGQGEKTDSFQNFKFNYETNDVLYLYTDGYADQFGGQKGKKFKYKNLNESLVELHHLNVEDQKEKLETTLKQWRGLLEQVDDICIMGIKF